MSLQRLTGGNGITGDSGLAVRNRINAAMQSIEAQWVDVREFGALIGDGATDNGATIQAAIDSGYPLMFPPGTFLISEPVHYTRNLQLRGAGSKNVAGAQHTTIMGNFPYSLFVARTTAGDDLLITYNPSSKAWELTQNAEPFGTGAGVYVENIRFFNAHLDGIALQVVAKSAPLSLVSCHFSAYMSAVQILSCFSAWVVNCQIGGGHFISRTWEDGHWPNAYGIVAGSHTLIEQCDIIGCGVGILATGAGVNIIGSRIEVCGRGVQLGGTSLAPGTFGQLVAMSGGLVTSLTLESNVQPLLLRSAAGAVTLRDSVVIGGAGAAAGIGKTMEYGLWVESASSETVIENLILSGAFERVGAYFGGAPIVRGLSVTNTITGKPLVGGLAAVLTTTRAGLAGVRLASGTYLSHDNNTHLRGLKGLDWTTAATMPNNLGGVMAVTEGQTSVAVVFPVARSVGDAAFNAVPNAQAGTGPGAGTYYYSTSLLAPRGETGVPFSDESIVCKSITLTDGQKANMTFFVGPNAGFSRRVYRGTQLGWFDGYWLIQGAAATFEDDGQTFDGAGFPPTITTIPSRAEPDAAYGVAVTPSWLTTARVTSKATTGFMIEFGTAAPAGATVDWLLFRP